MLYVPNTKSRTHTKHLKKKIMAEKTLYIADTRKNQQILASATENFSPTTADREAFSRLKRQFNFLDIINNQAEDVIVRIDGLTTREWLIPGSALFTLKAEENFFFTSYSLINQSSTNAIAADTIIINAAIKEVK